MKMYDIIYHKREGGQLTNEEIDFFVKGYTEGSIPDYQVAALLMAIHFQGMGREETYALTRAMRDSGDQVDLSEIKGIKVDKHSTGGVGDKTTFIVGPLAAACGVPIAKMSGRGLGFTGGTVDKMEAVPGLKTTLLADEFIHLVNRRGISVIGQTSHIAPADKKIYALRDVTATVDNLSLITSSVMSKKLASGSDAIVLDVKCGNGAFMETLEQATELGTLMVDIGKADGKKTIAVITDMNQPLGYAVGNSLEVIEAIDTLKGKGPEDITELSLTLAGYMIYAGEKAPSYEVGREMAKEAMDSGEALEKLKLLIEGQGGDARVIQDYGLLPQPSYHQEIYAEQEGFVTEVAARTIGLASQHAGAGRATKEEEIDLSAGIVLRKKTGDSVRAGDVLASIYGQREEAVKAGAEEAKMAFAIGSQAPQRELLVKKVIV